MLDTGLKFYAVPSRLTPGYKPWGGAGGQNTEHPHTLVILSSFIYLFFFFFFFCFKCILVLLARHSSGELRCPATALNVDVLYVCTKVRLINKSMQSRKFSIHILKTIRLTLNYYSIILQYLPQQGKDTWKHMETGFCFCFLGFHHAEQTSSG